MKVSITEGEMYTARAERPIVSVSSTAIACVSLALCDNHIRRDVNGLCTVNTLITAGWFLPFVLFWRLKRVHPAVNRLQSYVSPSWCRIQWPAGHLHSTNSTALLLPSLLLSVSYAWWHSISSAWVWAKLMYESAAKAGDIFFFGIRERKKKFIHHRGTMPIPLVCAGIRQKVAPFHSG